MGQTGSTPVLSRNCMGFDRIPSQKTRSHSLETLREIQGCRLVAEVFEISATTDQLLATCSREQVFVLLGNVISRKEL